MADFPHDFPFKKFGVSKEQFDNTVMATVLYQGHDADGKPFHAYLEMNNGQLLEFDANVQAGEPIDIRGYTMLHIGEGLEPPQEVRRRMEQEHGVSHGFEKAFKEELQFVADEYAHLKKYNIDDEQYIRQKAKEILKIEK